MDRNPKRKAQKGAEQENVVESPLTILNSRLLMQLAAKSRAHDALCEVVAFLPTAHACLMRIAAKGREFQKLKQEKAPNVSLAFVMKWRGFLEGVIEIPGVPEDVKNIARQLAHESDFQIQQHVHVCKTSKPYDRSKLRLTLQVEFDIKPLVRKMVDAIVPVGEKPIYGVAPRNFLERQIADSLVDMGVYQANSDTV